MVELSVLIPLQGNYRFGTQLLTFSHQGNYRFGTQPVMFSAKSKYANLGALTNNEGGFLVAGETTKKRLGDSQSSCRKL